jgi:hypothetical protein
VSISSFGPQAAKQAAASSRRQSFVLLIGCSGDGRYGDQYYRLVFCLASSFHVFLQIFGRPQERDLATCRANVSARGHWPAIPDYSARPCASGFFFEDDHRLRSSEATTA